MAAPVTVLISSRNRPLYLWACLDALYRGTQAPRRFVLVDMASDDPLVGRVLRGFERRGLFDELIRFEHNDPALLAHFILQSLPRWAPLFGYIESDVVVETTTPCWLTRMTALMEANPSLAMLGSAVDKRDFVNPEAVARLRDREDDAQWHSLIKANSPERHQDRVAAAGAPLFRPHSPAGRLLMMRTDALARTGLAGDHELSERFQALGYDTATATEICHRHLSLVQVFDYPDYDMSARDRYMGAAQAGLPREDGR